MDYLKELFKRYLANQCTEEEIKILLRYFELEEHSGKLAELVNEEFFREEDNIIYLSERRKETLESVEKSLMDSISPIPKKIFSRQLLKAASIAAAVIILLGFSFYIYHQNQPGRSPSTSSPSPSNDIEPGASRAMLILDNGKRITLDESKKEIETDEEGIKYTAGGSIIADKSVRLVTLATPRKGHYKTTLPDGTKVWLNAESSLKYPTQFTASERLTELRGEAYFEVAHDTAKPFIVSSKGQKVKVLGTRFNISSYENEPNTITTLVQGSIELSSGSAKTGIILKPGQQGRLINSGFQVYPVETEPFTAWTENEFSFKGASLELVLRQLERWYDIDVDFSTVPKHLTVTASLDRNKKLSSILHILERTVDIRFEFKGRRLAIIQ